MQAEKPLLTRQEKNLIVLKGLFKLFVDTHIFPYCDTHVFSIKSEEQKRINK